MYKNLLKFLEAANVCYATPHQVLDNCIGIDLEAAEEFLEMNPQYINGIKLEDNEEEWDHFMLTNYGAQALQEIVDLLGS